MVENSRDTSISKYGPLFQGHISIKVWLIIPGIHPAGDVMWVFVDPGNVVP